MENKIKAMSEFINMAVKKVVEEKVEIHAVINPENFEVSVQPWKPFEYKCPYSISE